MDSFYPVVSLLAFLSGGCFGFYYAWRLHSRTTAVTAEAVPSEPLRKAA